MANEISNIFSNLPAHVKNAKSQAMQAMAGGMAGGGFGNRISIKGSRFHLIQGGTRLQTLQAPTIDVVVFAMANSVQRFYYEGAYEPDTKTPPTCFSHDGKVPSQESPKLQSSTCSLCPQNVKGSARQGSGKACAYKKRVVVVSPDDIEGDVYALDVNGQSMFGEQQEAANKFSFKGYFEKLSVHNVDIAAIVTRISFDEDASVPKLHFTPVRALTESEYEGVSKRMNDEEVQLMLKDLTNIEEVDPPKPEPVKQQEPAKQATTEVESKAPKGVGGLVTAKPKGFGVVEQPVAKQAGGNGGAPPAPKKGLNIDLEKLVSFDDN